MNNITPKISEKLARKLHNLKNHPISVLKNIIYRHFGGFRTFDDLSAVVTVQENFDNLLIPRAHVSRQPSDTFYIDETHVLRTHTSAHQSTLLSQGHTGFLVTGDVYRRDAIDRQHYPVFHQMEGVKLCRNPELYLGLTIEMLINDLFPDCEYRRTDSYFPFTKPSFEYEVNWNGTWIEVLGCGVIQQEIINNCGLNGEEGWAFGLGLDRLAMILFGIPDIRLLWSEDPRFLSQFREGQIDQFVPFSRQPSCYKDVAFWLPGKFKENDFFAIAYEIGGGLIESVVKIDDFYGKDGHSCCYRLNYRSVDRTLTNYEVDVIQEQIRQAAASELEVKLR